MNINEPFMNINDAGMVGSLSKTPASPHQFWNFGLTRHRLYFLFGNKKKCSGTPFPLSECRKVDKHREVKMRRKDKLFSSFVISRRRLWYM